MNLTRLTHGRALIAASLLVLSACADGTTTAPLTTRLDNVAPSRSSAAAKGKADHVVVELKGTESSSFGAAVAALGGQIERRLPQVNLVVVKGLSAAGVTSLSSRTDVAHVTLDSRRQWIPHTSAQGVTTARRNRPPSHVDQSSAFFYDEMQWNMRVTKANQAWLTTPEGKGASVYVLDSGVDPDHLDLTGLVDLSKSVSFAEFEPNDIKDYESHGTFVSAIIASNGFGVASVAPLSKIVAVKVLDASGFGSFADVISGIVYAADQGADVINMSLGAYADLTDPGDQNLLAHIQAAIAYARLRGAVVVAAAGNDALNLIQLPPQFISVPAELIGVISAGATAPVNQVGFDQLASYSNFGWNGSPIGGVQVFAPGGDWAPGRPLTDLIFSACSQYQITLPFSCAGGTSYFWAAGTSFSSPMVSGEAAVLRSIVGNSTSASFTSANCVLSGTDVIGPSSVFGHGRMNVVKAASCAKH